MLATKRRAPDLIGTLVKRDKSLRMSPAFLDSLSARLMIVQRGARRFVRITGPRVGSGLPQCTPCATGDEKHPRILRTKALLSSKARQVDMSNRAARAAIRL